MSCTICHLQLPKIEEGYHLDEESYEGIDLATLQHFTCAEFKDIRDRWE